MMKKLAFDISFLSFLICFGTLVEARGADFRHISAVELQAKTKNVMPWFHSIDLGQGVITPGAATLEIEMQRANIYFGMGIEGYSVLDVGAWDGFYSFEAEKRGASRVMAVDKFCWVGPGYSRRPFELAREVLSSNVEDQILDIHETTVENLGQFDIVLFNGIVYHILDPFRALSNMASITRYMLTIETHVDQLNNPRPVAVFYPEEVSKPGYPTTGWGFNPLAMAAYLKQLGFETVLEFVADNPNRRIFLAFKPGHPFQKFVAQYSK